MQKNSKYFTIPLIIFLFMNGINFGQEKRKYPKIEKWKPQKNVQTYVADNLFDYINGASELYLSYNFEQLDVVYYRNRRKQEITVEIYTHASPLFAFGIYSQERSPDAKYLTLGSESYIDGSYLFILAGKHYLKLFSYDLGAEAESILTEIGQVIVEFLDTENSLPKELRIFPEKKRIPNSVQFIARNMLGYSFFSQGFQADYKIGDQKCRIFFIKSESIKATNDLFDRYITQIHHKPRIPGSNEYKIVDPYHGQGIIRKSKQYLYGGFGSAEINKILDEMSKNIGK